MKILMSALVAMAVLAGPQLGSVSVAPLFPYRLHRAERRSPSENLSAPQRIKRGTSAPAA
jgi:hypothetical protein